MRINQGKWSEGGIEIPYVFANIKSKWTDC